MKSHKSVFTYFIGNFEFLVYYSEKRNAGGNLLN